MPLPLHHLSYCARSFRAQAPAVWCSARHREPDRVCRSRERRRAGSTTSAGYRRRCTDGPWAAVGWPYRRETRQVRGLQSNSATEHPRVLRKGSLAGRKVEREDVDFRGAALAIRFPDGEHSGRGIAGIVSAAYGGRSDMLWCRQRAYPFAQRSLCTINLSPQNLASCGCPRLQLYAASLAPRFIRRYAKGSPETGKTFGARRDGGAVKLKRGSKPGCPLDESSAAPWSGA